jgi:hypothetical protein
VAERHDIFDHTIVIERFRGRWRARIWRHEYNDAGIIVGSVKIGTLVTRTRHGARVRAAAMVRQARRRGARWPHPPAR